GILPIVVRRGAARRGAARAGGRARVLAALLTVFVVAVGRLVVISARVGAIVPVAAVTSQGDRREGHRGRQNPSVHGHGGLSRSAPQSAERTVYPIESGMESGERRGVEGASGRSAVVRGPTRPGRRSFRTVPRTPPPGVKPKRSAPHARTSPRIGTLCVSSPRPPTT